MEKGKRPKLKITENDCLSNGKFTESSQKRKQNVNMAFSLFLMAKIRQYNGHQLIMEVHYELYIRVLKRNVDILSEKTG